MLDIAVPQENEVELCQMAKVLGYSGLILAYTDEKKIPKIFPKTLPCSVILISKHTKPSKFPVAVFSSENDRLELESRHPPAMIIGSEWHEPSDKIHYRVSGLNPLLCKIASEKRVMIAPNLSKLWTGSPVQKAVALGRISQNIRLCRKYGCRIVLASFAQSQWMMRSPQDIISLGVELGMKTEEAKKSVLQQIIQYPLH